MATTDTGDAEDTKVETKYPEAVEESSPMPPQDYTGAVGADVGSAVPASAPFLALQTAQYDLLIRSEVSAALQEMLSDVETAHTLSAELNHHNAIESLRSQLEAARNAVGEERAVREEQEELWAEEAKRREELGDKFVTELVRLSAEMVELERWREDNQKKVSEHGGLKDELKKSEEIIKKMKESAAAAAAEVAEAEVESAAAQQAADVVAAESATLESEDKTEDELLAEEEERELQAALAASLAEAEREKEARETEDSAKENEASEEKTKKEAEENVSEDAHEEGGRVAAGKSEASTEDEEAKEDEPTGESEPVAENVTPKAEAPPALESMPEYALMRIFGYLEAFDILSTAQVNVMLYSRVDLLFGLGGAIGESSAARRQNEGGNNAVSDASEDKKTAGSNSATASADSKPESTAASARAPTRVAIPPPAPEATKVSVPPAPAPTSSAAAATNPPRIAGVGGGITSMFSQLRPKAQQKSPDGESLGGSTTVTASTLTTTTNGVAPVAGGGLPAAGSDAAPGLNAAMASSMASKLTAAELSVIISMQTKLRLKEGELNQLRTEKDDYAARLSGVESVKDFLITKVRDAEKLHKDGQDELAKIARQVSSDQEVIAFLDGRVQELERNLKIAEDGKAEADEELGRLRNQGSQKVRVLSDMLQFEKEQLAESEREWKAQKKVLVKEVKSCRAQIVALQAERGGFNRGGSGSPGRLSRR